MIVVSEANFDLKFDISNLNYPGLYVHIAILVAKWPHRSNLTSDLNSVTYICYHASLACKGFLEQIQTMGHLSSIDERSTLVTTLTSE